MAAYLSKELRTTITIQRLSIRPLSSLVLKGLYIEDQKGDTLVYLKRLSLSLNDISTEEKILDIKTLSLEDGLFRLYHYQNEVHDNLHFLLDYFSGTDTSTSSSKPWKITLANLQLKGMHFIYRDEADSTLDSGINFSDIDVFNINGDIKKLHFIGDSIFANVEQLAFKEKTGFEILEFSSDLKVAPDQMRFIDLKIRSEQSNIQTNLIFDYDSFPDFSEFTRQIHWKTEFKNSTLAFSDIAYFASDLWGIKRSVNLEGNFKGTVNRFKGKNVSLKWGTNSHFTGDVAMYGLPNIDETFMDIVADEIQTNKRDIELIPVLPFESGKGLELPDNMAELGDVKFKGKFTGFYSDFVAYGNVNTAIGSLISDINVKYNPSKKSSFYSGHLSALNFDVGKITATNDLGTISFNAAVKGSGFQLNDVDARMTGNVTKLNYRNYTYQNIKVDGEIAKGLFSGFVTVHEPNVDLDFEGTVDFREALPVFNFNATIANANLDTLNILRSPANGILSTQIQSKIKGNKLDNLEGTVEINNTFLLANRTMYRVGKIYLNAFRISDNNKNIFLESDFLDGKITGRFELATLADALKEILPRYLPSVILPVKSDPGNQDFTYHFRLKNTSLLTELFLPSWRFDPQTILYGTVNSVKNTFDLDLQSPVIQYNALQIENFRLGLHGREQVLDIAANSTKVDVSAGQYFNDVVLNATAGEDQIAIGLQIANQDTSENKANIKAAMNFYNAKRFDIRIDSSQLLVQNKRWSIDPSNIVSIDSASVAFSNLSFSNANEHVRIDGILGKSEQENLTMSFDNFNLFNLEPILKSQNSKVGGIVNGNVILNEVSKGYQLESDLTIKDLVINNDTLGNATLISRYNNEQKIVAAKIGIIRGTAKVADIKGEYRLDRDKNNLDFDILLSNLYLSTIDRYLTDILHEVNGKVSADLKLTGTFKEPVFTGDLDFSRATCIVDYLNTRYSFNGRIKVASNNFDLTGIKLVDHENNEALVKGKIFHDNFSHFVFDLEVFPNKFHILNTTLRQNELYYGTAYASGYAHFYGPLENMIMDINVSPSKGTVINIPLSGSSEVLQSDFITFVNKKEAEEDEKEQRQVVNTSGIRLNMNLDMNPSATMNLIFDEKIGDIISGTGNGSIRLDINTNGEFNMYGTYTIQSGEYLFTLQNLINKKFNIDAGSHITWAGDPYDAIVDLSAVYVVYTSTLYNLLQDSTYKRRIPVDCRLFLTNKLLNPTISYEINVRGLDPTAQSLVSSFLNAEQEVNRQMFGLLVLNQFVPLSGTPGIGGGIDAGVSAGASASELLSNQVSNWLSQLSKDVSIGFNYRAKDTYSNEEIQLMFTKTLFNDRLLVEGNVGYSANQTQNTNSLVGDFYADYKVSEDGRFRLKGFNRSNSDNVLNYSSPYTQGFGVFFRQEFNNIKDLLQRLGLKKKSKEKGKE